MRVLYVPHGSAGKACLLFNLWTFLGIYLKQENFAKFVYIQT